MDENPPLIGVDVHKVDGNVERVMRPNREPFELDGVRYRLTGGKHGAYQDRHETAVPVEA